MSTTIRTQTVIPGKVGRREIGSLDDPIEGDGLWTRFAVRLSLLTILALLPAIAIGFVNGDDEVNFLDNVWFRGLGWDQLRWAWSTTLVGVYQPVAWMILEVQYAAWGLDPRGYHVASLGFHALNAAVLFFLTVRLVERCRPELAGRNRDRLYWSTFLAVALFAVHPLRVETVTWASSQPYLPCAFFSMLTILAYLRAHNETRPSLGWSVGSFVLYTLAVLCKAPAVSLPAVLLVLDVYPLRRIGMGKDGWIGRKAWGAALEKVPYAVLTLALMVVAVHARQSLKVAKLPPLSFRAAQACYSAGFYLVKSVVPTGLTTFYPFPLQPAWTGPKFLLGIAFVVGASAAALRVRHRYPGLTAAWAAYLVLLAPSSGLVPMGRAMVADRYSYLSMMAWVAPTAVLIDLLAGLVRGPSRTRLFAPAGVAAVAGLSVLSWYQCSTWRSDEALWTHALENSGGESGDIQNGLALALAQQGRFPEAEDRFAKALEYNPEMHSAQNNLGMVLLDQGKLDAAVPHFIESIRLKPESANPYNNLGMVYSRRGKMKEAAFFFREAVRLKPVSPEMRNNLGMSLFEQGRADEAVEQFNEALRIKPGYLKARRNLAKAVALRDKLRAERRPSES